MRIPRPGRSRRRLRAALVGSFALFPILLVGFWIPFEDYVRSYLEVRTSRGALLRTADGRRDLRAILRAVPSTYLRRPQTVEVPRLVLDIRFKNLKRLRDKRAAAQELGVLFSSDADYVPARLTVDDRTIRVRVRLKGDLADHFRGRRWSLRVKTRGGAAVFGMRRFSLQGPHTRGFQAEPLFLEFLKAHGVLVPRYQFVELVINGERIGLMAMEEHFAKELLESQQRREGVILKYDETPYWRATLLPGQTTADFDNWRNATVTAFRPSKIAESPTLGAQYALGVGLLRGVMEDRLAPSAAFDADLWGTFYAACELFTAGHMVAWNNVRLYLNPVTELFEPIGFDSNMSHHWGETDLFDCQEGRLHLAMTGALLADPEMRGEFVKRLHELRAEVSSEAFLRDWRAREAHYLAILRRDFPWLREFDLSLLQERVDQLAGVTLETYSAYVREREPRNIEYASGAVLPQIVHAELRGDGAANHIALANAISRPVHVQSVRFVPEEIERDHPLRERVLSALPLQLPASHWPEIPASARIDFTLPPSTGAAVPPAVWSVVGVARIAGDARDYSFEVPVGYAPLAEHPIPRATLAEALAQHPFLVREAPGLLRAERGHWDVVGSLVLPEGYSLTLEAGTHLRFGPGAGLLARGDLRFRGTAESPIVLEGRKLGEAPPVWLGLAALGESLEHDWEHVVVRHTTGVRYGSWELTGGVTLRRSDVAFRDVVFDGSSAEDALNLIRSSFVFEGVTLRDTRSDAFDCDFCVGKMIAGRIENVGGDGVDVSGSNIVLERVAFHRVRDKAISVGERSELRARSVTISDCGTGFASKDGSTGFVEDSRFDGIEHVALMAYVKKSEYGGASIEVRRSQVVKARRIAIAEIGSRLLLDGKPVEPVELDVDALYSEGYMKK